LNQAGLPQLAKRSTHRDSGGSEPFHEGGFTRQFLTRLIPTGKNFILHGLHDLLIFGQLDGGF
jgi:hypothetical protein